MGKLWGTAELQKSCPSLALVPANVFQVNHSYRRDRALAQYPTWRLENLTQFDLAYLALSALGLSLLPWEGSTWAFWKSSWVLSFQQRHIRLPGKHSANLQRILFLCLRLSYTDDGSKLNPSHSFPSQLGCLLLCIISFTKGSQTAKKFSYFCSGRRWIVLCFVFSAVVTKAFQEFVRTGERLWV